MLKKLGMAWLIFYFWSGLAYGTKVEDVRIPVAANISLTGKLYQQKDLKQAQPTLIFIAPWSVGIWVYDKKPRNWPNEVISFWPIIPEAGAGRRVKPTVRDRTTLRTPLVLSTG